MDKTLVYLILGTPGSGRRSFVADLIEFGLDSEKAPSVFESEMEEPKSIVSKNDISIGRYSWDGETLKVPIPDDAPETVFIVADGHSDPADFVEAFHSWLSGSSFELGRIITVVDCSLAEKFAKLRPWLDCCIHFSDVAILAKRTGVSNKWVSSFQDRYETELCFPCLFEMDRKGRVRNPALVLDPVARRISRIFDDPEEFEFEDDDLEEEEIIDEELIPGDLSSDPYLKRVGSGRRSIVLPKVSELLKNVD